MSVKRTKVALSRRVLAMEASPTQAMSQRAAALQAMGRSILDFSVGEPDQDTPARVVAAGQTALGAGRTRYAPSAGLRELRVAVVGAYRRDFGVSFGTDEVTVATGGKHALYLTFQALLNQGDEVLVPSPYWPTFFESVRLGGGRPKRILTKEDEGFALSAAQVAKAVTAKTRALVVNSPCNPTGAVVGDDELLAIGRLARRHKLTLIYDDTYARLTFEKGTSEVLQSLREMLPGRFAIIGSTSKSYGMTGWRVGWVLGPRPLVEACSDLASHSTQSPATFAQVGAVEALTGPQDVVEQLRAEYHARRDYLHPKVAALPGVSCFLPQGGFYLFPNVKRLLSRRAPTTLALAGRLLEDAGLAVVPGEGFGRPGYLRLSFARPMEELREGVARLADFAGALAVK